MNITLDSTARLKFKKDVHQIGGVIPFVVLVIAIQVMVMMVTAIKQQVNVFVGWIISNPVEAIFAMIAIAMHLGRTVIVAIH